jgi:hypothetical protein
MSPLERLPLFVNVDLTCCAHPAFDPWFYEIFFCCPNVSDPRTELDIFSRSRVFFLSSLSHISAFLFEFLVSSLRAVLERVGHGH